MNSESRKIVWLASYPKSGNTWFRAFLTALMNEGEVDINDLSSDGIFSLRWIIDEETDLDSTYLYHEEVMDLQPEVYLSHAKTITSKVFYKIHDALGRNRAGKQIVPPEVTCCALYFIRNPLDVCVSFAAHLGVTIDQAVKMMNSKEAYLVGGGNLNTHYQVRQDLNSWSGHVVGWTTTDSFPVHVVRYEDMLTEPFETFKMAVRAVGLEFEDQAIWKAIEASRFESLKRQETEKRFREAPAQALSFFRSGKSGGWKDVLTEEQAEALIGCHEQAMKEFGYL